MINRKRKQKVRLLSPNAANIVKPSGHFGLAPLTKLAPERLVPAHGDDKFSMLILALAVVFNDMKGLLLLYEPIASSRPPDGELTGHAGEWHGLDMQLHRLRIGVIHELFNLIKEFEQEATGAQMHRVLKRTTVATRANWSDLVAIAIGKGNSSGREFAKQIVRIRNNVAFHYYQPKDLIAGYRRHFFESPKSAANEHAYCSIGKNMERTRFYFADAAIQGALQLIQNERGPSTFVSMLQKSMDATNVTLARILEEYTRPARRH